MKAFMNLILVFLTAVVGSRSFAMDLSFSMGSENNLPNVSQLSFMAPTGHHFNEKAPSLVQTLYRGKNVRAKSIRFEGRKAIASWDNLIDKCHIDAILYICDDKNTYCLPQKQSFTCKGYNVVKSEWVPTVLEAALPDGVKRSEESSIFLENEPDKALKLAREKHFPLLIDFYGIWCPPCNQIDEIVFRSKQFQDFKSEFVFLKMDADSPDSWPLKSKYKVTGYPTVVLASENGEEISRIVGYRDLEYFVSEMRKVLSAKDVSFDEKRKRADLKDDPKAAFEVGVMNLNRDDFAGAHFYLLKASRTWDKKDPRRNKLLSAQLGMHSRLKDEGDRRIYAKLLEDALQWYPEAVEAIDRSAALVRVAGDLEDKILEARGLKTQVRVLEWFLAHPKKLTGEDYSIADLYETLGEAYEGLGEKAQSQKAFERAAQEYGLNIKNARLDESSERGFNLERIYCLWKSGKPEIAQNMYEHLEKIYPKEFTFYYQHASLLKELGRNKEALDKGLSALEYSYGDNRLRVVGFLADIYQKLGEKKKALNLLDETINQFQLPEDKSIRTHRYFEKLKKLKGKIAEA